MVVELARRLADSYVLPFNVTDYSRALRQHVARLKQLHGAAMIENGLRQQLGETISRRNCTTSIFSCKWDGVQGLTFVAI